MERKYTAFISYRHMPLDMMVADKLHKLIEHYHIPKDLRKQPDQKRFGFVFRDREELPLSNDLTKDIYDALDASEFLIVVCTPDTPKSKWVDREIEYFLKHHGREKILTVLASGTQAESVPERVTNIYDTDGVTVIDQKEPLCAFLTDSSERKVLRNLRAEWLRIAAALLEKPYDAVRQRKRLYQMKMGLMFLSAAIVITGAYTGMLVSKNREIRGKNIQIQQQFQEAQWNESQALTLLSGNQLADGDRKGALESAIAALPTKEHPRPYYSGAKTALEEALYMYEDFDYRSDGKIEIPSGLDQINQVALSKDSRYLVGATDAARIVCYDLFTQEEIWNIPYLDEFLVESFYFFEEQSAVWCTSCGGGQYILNLENGEVLETYQFTSRTFPTDYSDEKSQAAFVEKNQIVFCGLDGTCIWSEEMKTGTDMKIITGTYNKEGEKFLALCRRDFEQKSEFGVLYFDTDTGILEQSVTLDESDFMDEMWHLYLLPLQDGSYFLSFVCQEIRVCMRMTEDGEIAAFDGFYFPDHYSNYGDAGVFSSLEGKIRQIEDRIYMVCPNRVYCIDADTCEVLSETYFEEDETFCRLLENGTLVLMNDKNELCQYVLNREGELEQICQWYCPVEVPHYSVEDRIIWAEENQDAFLVNDGTAIRTFRMLGGMDGGEAENCYQIPVEQSGNYIYLPAHCGAFVNQDGTKVFFRDADGYGENRGVYDTAEQTINQMPETAGCIFPLAFTSDGRDVIYEEYAYEPGDYGLEKQMYGIGIYDIKNNRFETFEEAGELPENTVITTTSMNDQKQGEAVLSAAYSEGVLHWWLDGKEHHSKENPYHSAREDLYYSVTPGQNGLIVTECYKKEAGEWGEEFRVPVWYMIYDINKDVWKRKESFSSGEAVIQTAKTKPLVAFAERDEEDAYLSVYDFEKNEIILRLQCEIEECEMMTFLLEDSVLFINYDNLYVNLYTFVDIVSGQILGQFQGDFHNGIYEVTNKKYLQVEEDAEGEYLYISSRLGEFAGRIVSTDDWSVEHEVPGMIGYLRASDSLLCIDDAYRNVYTKKLLNVEELIEKGKQILAGSYR